MMILNIICQAAAPYASGSQASGLSFILPAILIVALVLLVVKYTKKNKQEDYITTSPSQINKVVNVNLIGGIIGLFSSSPQNRLNEAISEENAYGWKVIQVIPAESGNLFLIILRLLLLVITLFLYTTVNGYYLIMEKKSDSGKISE